MAADMDLDPDLSVLASGSLDRPRGSGATTAVPVLAKGARKNKRNANLLALAMAAEVLKR